MRLESNIPLQLRTEQNCLARLFARIQQEQRARVRVLEKRKLQTCLDASTPLRGLEKTCAEE